MDSGAERGAGPLRLLPFRAGQHLTQPPTLSQKQNTEAQRLPALAQPQGGHSL